MRQLERAWIFGCGYLGAPLLARWVAAGVGVTAFTRSADKARELTARGARGVRLEGELEATLPREPADVVVWAVGFDRTSTREEAWLAGLGRLSAALRSRGDWPRVIYVSTTGVYGDASGGDVDEATPPAPSSDGGRVALLAEAQVRAFGREACAVRLAGIFGPGRLLRKVDEVRRGLVLSAPPEHWLNLVHVDDAATLVDAAARSESMPPVVNGAMADVPTRRRYYEALAKSFEAPTPRFEQQENGEEPASDRRVVSTVRAQLCGFRYEDVDAALRAITSAS